VRSAFITGLAGPVLTPDERQFLRDSEPAGLILFQRNCVTPEQLRRLVDEACDAIGHNDTLVLVDQEGGRVQRMQPPQWRSLPAAARLGRAYDRDPERAVACAEAVGRVMAHDLKACGLNANCAPLLDRLVTGAHDIIGDRAFADDNEAIIALARAMTGGLHAGGVVAIGKHVPGHGRARADSHAELPIVEASREELAATDFAPFQALAGHVTAMMTAHVVYADIDSGDPASTSPTVHTEVIRGAIGFDGLVMSDDLSMRALDGPMAARAARVIKAGSDVALHCNGDLDEMEAVAGAVPILDGAARRRADDCWAVTIQASPTDITDAEACVAELVSKLGSSA